MVKKLPERKHLRLRYDAYRKGNAFSITIATWLRYPWFRIYPDLAATTTQAIHHLAEQRKSNAFAWCLMPDHLHLLIKDSNVMDYVRILKGRLTPVARKSEPGRRLWQRSFYDHGLRKEESLETVARYIWENPIRAGLVTKYSDYPYIGGSLLPIGIRGRG